MRLQRNIENVFVGASGGVARTSGAKINTLAEGEIALFSTDGTLLTTSNYTSYTHFIVAQGTTTQPVVSPAIPFSKATKIGANAYSADTQQVTYVGFNGTSGSLDVSNNTVYYLRVVLKHSNIFDFNRDQIKFGTFKTGASASEKSLADGMTANLIKNFSKEHEKFVKFERVINNAGTALGTGVDDVVFTNGSKVISATDIDDATTNAAIAVGDYLRVGTATTDPVYRIVSIDSTANTAVLDIEYQGATATIADTGLERIPAATAASASFGIKATGLAQTFVAPGKSPSDSLVRFEIQIDNTDWGTTEVENSTSPSLGNGTYAQVANAEWFAQGHEGDPYRSNPSGPNLREFRKLANASSTYDVTTITYVKDEPMSIGSSVQNHGSILIATNTTPGTSIAGAASSVADILDAAIAAGVVTLSVGNTNVSTEHGI